MRRPDGCQARSPRRGHPTHLAGVHEHFLEHFSEVELRAMAQYWRRALSGA